MAEIAVTALSQLLPEDLTTASQVVTFTQDGDTNRASLFEAVSAANSANGCECVKTMVVDVSSAEILAFTTPVYVTETPAANQYIDILTSVIEYTHGGTDYSGGGNIIIANTNGSQFYFDGVIQESASRFVKGIPTIPTSADSNIALGEAMVALMLVNPTLGNGTVRIRTTYIVHEQ